MSYFYELHAHTRVGSACANAEPEEYIPYYIELGYSGMVITDHFYYGNTAIERDLEWREFTDRFCDGYRRAKAEGDKRGFSVFFGFEQRFSDGMDEYLTIGLSPEWLADHSELKDIKRQDFFDLVHASGGYVIQAHPFRDRFYIDSIKLSGGNVDAIELYNSCNDESECRMAYEYVQNLGLPVVGGSDIHGLKFDKRHSGVAVPHKLNAAQELIEAIKNRKTEVLPLGIVDEIKALPLVAPKLPVYKLVGNEMVATDDYFYKNEQ